MTTRCASCGLINAPTDSACRRCKRSLAGPSADDDEMPVLDVGAFEGAGASMQAAPPPRREPPGQHYFFAHVMLRDMMLSDPRTLVGLTKMAIDGVANDLLRRMWATAAEEVQRFGGRGAPPSPAPEARALPDGVLIRMPPPARPPECLYVAALAEPPGRIRYFTLEKAGPPTREPFMLCEWTSQHHGNMGPFVESSEEAFLARVRSLLRRA